MLIFLVIVNISAMEAPKFKKLKLSKNNSEIENIIIGEIAPEFKEAWITATKQEVVSLKSIAALKIKRNQIKISENHLPEELTDFIKKFAYMHAQIECTRMSKACTTAERKILLNIANNPNFDIKKYFPIILRNSKNNLDQTYVRHITNNRAFLDNILLEAAQHGDINLVKAALALGATSTAINRFGLTALMLAASEGHAEIAFFLSQCANINFNNKFKESALMEAASNGNKKIVEMLLSKGANINNQSKSGFTALMLAVVNNKKEIVEILLADGADITIKNLMGKNALNLALQLGYLEIAELLEQADTSRQWIYSLDDQEMSDLMALNN